jgi:hypothetical protein
MLTCRSSHRYSIILETDPIAIASRVSRPKPDAGVNLSEITINEQTLMAVSPAPLPLHPLDFILSAIPNADLFV